MDLAPQKGVSGVTTKGGVKITAREVLMEDGSMLESGPVEASIAVDRLKASTYAMTSTEESSLCVCLAISFRSPCGSVKFLI